MSQSRYKRGQALSATKRLTLTAVFAALSFAAMFVFRFNVQFLTFDLKDAIVTIAGLLLGPLAAFTVSLLVSTLEFITVGDTGWYGFLMNFVSTAVFAVLCAVVYRYKKKLSGAVLGLGLSVVVMTAVMLVMNLWVTPAFTGWPLGDVIAIMPTLLLPFNLVKGVVNAALVLILYKPVHQALQAARLMPATLTATPDPAARKTRVRRSICVSCIGLVLLVAAILIFYFVLGGQFDLFKH